MELIINKIRTTIYIVGFVTILLSIFCKCHAYELQDKDIGTESEDETSNEFWPPDLVPHPDLPGTGPSGTGEPDMA